MTDLTVERAGEGWTVTTRCEAEPEGTLGTTRAARLEHAVAVARRIAQWSDETAAALSRAMPTRRSEHDRRGREGEGANGEPVSRGGRAQKNENE